mmetsp:Transcript_31985/g.28978  ORF Transcript_31985/g.28978 Transcript_31985/m.28978 type:complete len:149 (+) Transcript_31985:167-613(+)
MQNDPDGTLNALVRGIHEVAPKEILESLNEKEIELLINGPRKINVESWKENTEYDNLDEEDELTLAFWKHVESLDDNGRLILIMSLLGTSRLPDDEFKGLPCTMDDIRLFTLMRTEDEEQEKIYCDFSANTIEIPPLEDPKQFVDMLI